MINLDMIRKSFIFILIISPIFFTFSNGIYNISTSFSLLANNLGNHLFPISILILPLILIILILKHKIQKVDVEKIVLIIATIFLMTIGFLFQENAIFNKNKLIIMIQFILPIFALALPYYFSHAFSIKIVPRISLFLFAIIMITQLINSWLEGSLLISPNLIYLKIYQYRQYVSTIILSLVFFGIIEDGKMNFTNFLIVMLASLYSAASASFTSIIIFIIGLKVYIIFNYRKQTLKSILYFSAGISTTILYLLLANGKLAQNLSISEGSFKNKYKIGYAKTNYGDQDERFNKLRSYLPVNLVERIFIWEQYLNKISKNFRTFLFGNSTILNKNKYPSAHNYYIDFIYHFGFIAICPLLLFISRSFYLIYQNFNTIKKNNYLVALVFVFIVLVIFDNSFKVGMRQPHFGIITYFFWGQLFIELKNLSSKVDYDKQLI